VMTHSLTACRVEPHYDLDETPTNFRHFAEEF